MDFNISLEEMAAKYKDKTSKYFADKEITLNYIHIEEYSRVLCGYLLEKGIKKGDRVGVCMGNVPEYLLLLAATLRLGAVFVPLNVYLSFEDVKSVCVQNDCRILFVDSRNPKIPWKGYCENAEDSFCEIVDIGKMVDEDEIWLPIVDFIPDKYSIRNDISMEEPLVILYTSGTTGKNKCIYKSLSSFLGKNGLSKGIVHTLDFVDRVKGTTLFNFCPWYHNTGITLLIIGLTEGFYEETTFERFQVEQVVKILKMKHFLLGLTTPTMMYRICKSCDENVKLPEIIVSTGEALSFPVMEELEKHEIKLLYNGYGTTEIGAIAAVLYQFKSISLWMKIVIKVLQKLHVVKRVFTRDDMERYTNGNLLGVIHDSAEVLIWNNDNQTSCQDGQVGEICVCSSTKMLSSGDIQEQDIVVSYYGKNYLRTGDEGYRLGDLLFCTGRRKNMIIRSGENIIPADVERYAEGYPDINDAVACGVPDTTYGEEICLCIESSKNDFDFEALKVFLQEKGMPKYMVPRYYFRFEKFPLNVSGKKDYRKIKKEAMRNLGLSVER